MFQYHQYSTLLRLHHCFRFLWNIQPWGTLYAIQDGVDHRHSIGDADRAVLVGIGLNREPQPKDTFDDPYLAYAEVEKVFAKISGTVAYGAEKVTESEQTLDKLTYWK